MGAQISKSYMYFYSCKVFATKLQAPDGCLNKGWLGLLRFNTTCKIMKTICSMKVNGLQNSSSHCI